ncbi:MAG: hypothetical protein SVU32_02070, partial [Candidatus Nanohaloarchaea archaeon]|nr:hypothetical protein [Candidatus Nanohaloarchaea archaeon]
PFINTGYRIDESEDDGEDWPVLFIDHRHLGQMACHLPRDELPDHFEEKDVEYDGHTREEKLDRIQRWLDSHERPDYPPGNHPAGLALVGAVTGAGVGGLTAGLGGAVFGVAVGTYLGLTGWWYRDYCRRTRIWGSKPIHRRVLNAVTNPRSMRKT